MHNYINTHTQATRHATMSATTSVPCASVEKQQKAAANWARRGRRMSIEHTATPSFFIPLIFALHSLNDLNIYFMHKSGSRVIRWCLQWWNGKRCTATAQLYILSVPVVCHCHIHCSCDAHTASQPLTDLVPFHFALELDTLCHCVEGWASARASEKVTETLFYQLFCCPSSANMPMSMGTAVRADIRFVHRKERKSGETARIRKTLCTQQPTQGTDFIKA